MYNSDGPVGKFYLMVNDIPAVCQTVNLTFYWQHNLRSLANIKALVLNGFVTPFHSVANFTGKHHFNIHAYCRSGSSPVPRSQTCLKQKKYIRAKKNIIAQAPKVVHVVHLYVLTYDYLLFYCLFWELFTSMCCPSL